MKDGMSHIRTGRVSQRRHDTAGPPMAWPEMPTELRCIPGAETAETIPTVKSLLLTARGRTIMALGKTEPPETDGGLPPIGGAMMAIPRGTSRALQSQRSEIIVPLFDESRRQKEEKNSLKKRKE